MPYSVSRYFRSLLFAVLVTITTTGCETTYNSVCEEMAAENSEQLRRMIKSASKSSFERHVVLLETGNEISSNCRSHMIDKNTFEGIPGSLSGHCLVQGGVSAKYCLLYQVDKRPVEMMVFN